MLKWLLLVVYIVPILMFDFNAVSDKLLNTSIVKNSFTDVVEGSFRFWQTTDCLSILYEKSPFESYFGCYLQNPGAPYGLMLFPPHTDETIDEYYGFPIEDENQYTGTWHLKPNDVIVLLGLTPPECKYFSFSNYLYSRHLDKDWVPDYSLHGHSRLCPNGTQADRCEFFASLDDSLNIDRGLNLEANPFNSTLALVLGASVEGIEIAKKALVEAGVSVDLISNYSFPGTELELGINTNSDTFITVMRTAYYSSMEDADDYFKDVPYRVFRMELNDEDITLFNRQKLVERKTGKSELQHIGVSKVDMVESMLYVGSNLIKNAITDDIKKWNIQVTETKAGTPDNGFDCIEHGVMCLADCRDTVYPFSMEIYDRAIFCENKYSTTDDCVGLTDGLLTEDENDVIYVLGINHAKTNMSSYASISVYDANYFWGVDGLGDAVMDSSVWNYITPNDTLKDTVQRALSFMYVIEIRRQCKDNKETCLEVSSSATDGFTKGFIPLKDIVVLIERMYNNPVTHVGPDPSEVILPLIVHMRYTG